MAALIGSKSQLVCGYTSNRVTLRLPSLAQRGSLRASRVDTRCPGRLVVARERTPPGEIVPWVLGQPLAEEQPPDRGEHRTLRSPSGATPR